MASVVDALGLFAGAAAGSKGRPRTRSGEACNLGIKNGGNATGGATRIIGFLWHRLLECGSQGSFFAVLAVLAIMLAPRLTCSISKGNLSTRTLEL